MPPLKCIDPVLVEPTTQPFEPATEDSRLLFSFLIPLTGSKIPAADVAADAATAGIGGGDNVVVVVVVDDAEDAGVVIKDVIGVSTSRLITSSKLGVMGVVLTAAVVPVALFSLLATVDAVGSSSSLMWSSPAGVVGVDDVDAPPVPAAPPLLLL